MHNNEKQQIAKLKEGDRKAFEKIFKKHFIDLCTFAQRYVYELDEAKDIVQFSFVKLWEVKDTLKPDTKIKAYLHKVVQNNCLDQLKHNKIKQSYQKFVLDKEQANASLGYNGKWKDPAISNEIVQKIQAAIEQLPKDRRKIFEMSRFERKKYKEIAESLNISIKTVETQMSRSLSFLKENLKSYTAELPGLLIFLDILQQ